MIVVNIIEFKNYGELERKLNKVKGKIISVFPFINPTFMGVSTPSDTVIVVYEIRGVKR